MEPSRFGLVSRWITKAKLPIVAFFCGSCVPNTGTTKHARGSGESDFPFNYESMCETKCTDVLRATKDIVRVHG